MSCVFRNVMRYLRALTEGAGVGKAIASIFGGGQSSAPQVVYQTPAAAAPAPLPQPPAVDPAAVAATDAAAAAASLTATQTAADERRKAVGKATNNPTGGLGDTSTPNLAAKSLLGA